jgi:hypothetical protein
LTIGHNTGRLAGLLYLIVVVTGLFSLAYVPSQITHSSDSRAIVSNIMQSELLFRLGIASFMVEQVAFLLLPLVLFRLLRPVGEVIAALMVLFALVSIPIALVSVSARLDALSLLTDARYVMASTSQQREAEVLLALGRYANGLFIAKMFWGLWLLPFGYLVFKSGFLPKILGILLMLGCLGYMIDVFGQLLVPGYADSVVDHFATLPAGVGEIATCLWLLIVGARYPRFRGPASA